jgi:hypothetical protein
MTITSTSTQAQVLAQYADNIDWDGDLTKAKNCLAAVRWLRVNRPTGLRHGERQLNYDALAEEQKALEAFIRSADSTRSVARTSFTEGRMHL